MRPSLEIVFSSSSGPPKTKGPYRALRFEGEVLRETPEGPLIAKHESNVWQVEGEPYGRLECTSRLLAHFEHGAERSPVYGPYATLSFVDGVAYADHEIFAFIDRSAGDWYSHPDERHWQLMIVEGAY